MSTDYYAVLGIDKKSSDDDIKRAYRKLAMQHHPDRGGDPEKFKEINEAYSVLGNKDKRFQYDKFGSVGGYSSGGFDVDLSDIFESFFGGQRAKTRQNPSNFRGENIEETISIDLKTAILGSKYELKYKKYIKCDKCDGVGGSGVKTCPTCDGVGQVRERTQTVFGTIEHTKTCPTCHGSGESIDEVCEKCNGKKRLKVEQTIEVDIPSGIDDGMIIKIAGAGNDGLKDEPGDLYIKFVVDQDFKNLRRDGNDLYYDLEVDVIEAILGTTKTVNIPIIGKRTIDIKRGTQVGSIIKQSGDGVKYIDRDKKGDLFINLNIKIPKRLSEVERKNYEAIAKSKSIEIQDKRGIMQKLFK